jgi:adenylate cyclase
MAEQRLQRRLAAILSADVVGYSRLMGIDEAGTLARLGARPSVLFVAAHVAHCGPAD